MIKKELERLNAEPWMVDLLKCNPDYPFWGNYEDYMIKDSGWDARAEIESVSELWTLDNLNEVVNFYFEICRESHECEDCEGSGFNPETKQISDDWYDFGNTGRRWCENITQDGAVLFNKPRSNIETVNDLDGNVVNLFEWIKEDPGKLAHAIYFTPYVRQIYEDVFKVVPEDSLQQAVNFYTILWEDNDNE